MSGLRPFFKFLHEATDSSRTNLIIWLCPHKTITFEEARRMLLYKPPSADENYVEKVFECEDRACHHRLAHGVAHQGKGGSHRVALLTEIILLVVNDCDDHVQAIRQHFTTNRVKLALGQLDFPLCRHLRTSDPVVYNHYTPNCTIHSDRKGQRMDCKCSGPSGAHRTTGQRQKYYEHERLCQKCRKVLSVNTLFYFDTRHEIVDETGKLILSIVILQDLRRLEKDFLPEWRFHAQTPAQTELYSQQWQRWIDYRQGTMAGWETRPATPIFEEPTNESTPDERRSPFGKCMSLLHKDFGTKRNTSHLTLKVPEVIEQRPSSYPGTLSNLSSVEKVE